MSRIPEVFRIVWWKIYRKENKELRSFFINVLGFRPRNILLYQIALIHRSKTTINRQGHKVNNERLEYLGDAVLSTIVADYLYRKYPCEGEGFLTQLRSRIVSRTTLNQLSDKIGLVQFINYNHANHTRYKSMGGDALEALIGAVYLERGYRFTRRLVVKKILNTYLDIEALAHTDWNYKSKILDWGQKHRVQIGFEVVKVIYQGHEHRKQYECRVTRDGQPMETAIAYTVKEAEQLASEKSYKILTASHSGTSSAPEI